MGTRLLAADELWSHRKFKEFLADAKGTEGTVVKKAMRDHHRVLRNDSARTVKALDAAGVTDFEQFRPHVMGALAHDAYLTGDASRGMLDFGPAAMFADCLEPMESIFDGLIDDADAAAQRLQSPQATVPEAGIASQSKRGCRGGPSYWRGQSRLHPCIVRPPLTDTTWPVMKSVAGVAK